MAIGRPASWLKDAARVSWGASKRVAGGAARGVADHPAAFMGVAAGLGLMAGFNKSGLFGDASELITGNRTALGDTATGVASAVFIGGWDPNERNNPYSALNNRGEVYATPEYLYGRPVQGGRIGGIAGSRVLGGYNMGDYPGRVPAGMRGSPQGYVGGRNRIQGAEGSLVFGQYKLRR